MPEGVKATLSLLDGVGNAIGESVAVTLTVKLNPHSDGTTDGFLLVNEAPVGLVAPESPAVRGYGLFSEAGDPIAAQPIDRRVAPGDDVWISN